MQQRRPKSSHIPSPKLINSVATVNTAPRYDHPVAARAVDRAAIDPAQCKRISVQDKPLRRDGDSLRLRRARFSNRQKRLGPPQILSVRPRISGQANFAELWDCPITTGGLIKNNMNTNWFPHV
jgi:hypothetical protein